MGAFRRLPDRLADRLVSFRRTRKPAARIALAAMPLLAAGAIFHVTVHSGDTLSGIAARACTGQVKDWTGIWAQNKAVIGGNPNLIMPGQKLAFRCEDPPQLLKYGSTGNGSGGRIWGVSYGYPDYCGDGDGDGWDVKCSSSPVAPVTTPSVQHVSTAGDSSFQACVIARESGGNSQVMNSSGHYGLYQFSEPTWAAYGGNPADFGHASPAEQTQVFDNAIAAGGESNWSPYDGC